MHLFWFRIWTRWILRLSVTPCINPTWSPSTPSAGINWLQINRYKTMLCNGLSCLFRNKGKNWEEKKRNFHFPGGGGNFLNYIFTPVNNAIAPCAATSAMRPPTWCARSSPSRRTEGNKRIRIRLLCLDHISVYLWRFNVSFWLCRVVPDTYLAGNPAAGYPAGQPDIWLNNKYRIFLKEENREFFSFSTKPINISGSYFTPILYTLKRF